VGSSGAGKSALLADWVAAHSDRRSAWLNCDPADADPVRFVAAVVEAMRRAGDRSELGEDALQLLSLDGEVSADVIAALVDDLDEPDGADVLVIDDLHLAGTSVAESLGLLLQYQLRSLRLVVASRVDPSLRLHRMRANDELVELRDRDLCFSADETKVFLSGFGVQLTEPDLSLVVERSEGWIAGLQMAAISMRDSSDPPSTAGRLQLRPHTVAGYSSTRSFTVNLPRLWTSCWRRRSSTTSQLLRVRLSAAPRQWSFSSACTAITCSRSG
jgi:LuxR family maltose regulon positive regulatory protein